MMRRLIILLLIVGCDETVAPDTTAPTVAITYPANGSTLTTTDTIRVDVSSESAISSVKFLIDGIEVYADSLPPYEYVWDVCVQGTDNHTVLVKAEDITGNQGQSDVNTYTLNASYDCESVCGGDKLLDNCEVCDADAANDPFLEKHVPFDIYTRFSIYKAIQSVYLNLWLFQPLSSHYDLLIPRILF